MSILNPDLANKWRDRISMPLEDIDPQNPAHLALLNDQGMSFNAIEKIWGVPHSVAHKQVRQFRGIRSDGKKAHKYSLARVVCEEYLKDKKLPQKHKQEIALWLNRNAERLQSIEGKFLTVKQENDTLRREQSPRFTGYIWGDVDENGIWAEEEESIELWV